MTLSPPCAAAPRLDEDHPPAEAAPALLLARYYPAIRAYLARLLRDGDLAEDVAHDVVVKVLRSDTSRWDPRRGRYCDFLKTVARHAALDHLRRKRAALGRRGAAGTAGEGAWWRLYRQEVLLTALEGLRRYEDRHPRAGFASLIADLVAADGAPEAACDPAGRKRKERARRMFAQLIVAAVRAALDEPTPDRLRAELRYLGLLAYVRLVLEGAGD